MRNKFKRFTAWILCLGMILSAIPVQNYGYAAETAVPEYVKGTNEIEFNFTIFGNGRLWDKKGELENAGLKLNSELGSTYYIWIQSGNPYKQNQFVSGTGLDLNLMPSVGDAVFDFTVPADGYYKLSTDVKAYPNLSGKVQISFINGTDRTAVGTVDMTGATTGTTYTKEGFTVPEYEMVYLNKGTCQLVLTGIQDVGMNKFLLEKITITEYVLKGEEGEETPEYIKGDSEIKLNFGLASNGQLRVTNPSAVDGWTMNWDLTGTELKNLAQGDRYAKWYAFQYSAGSYNGLKLVMGPTYGDIAFNFTVSEAGWYKLSGNVQASEGHSGKVQVALKSGDARSTAGTIDMSGVGGTSGAWTKSGFTMPEFEMVYLEAGENQLILTGLENGVGGMNNILLEDFTLTEYVEKSEEAPEYVKGDDELAFVFTNAGNGRLWDKQTELGNIGWKLNSELGSTYYTWIQSGNPYKQNQFLSGTGLDLNLMPSVGDAVFDFTVPADGYYKLSTDVKAYPNLSGKVQISFINGNERTAVGTVDMTGATTGTTYTKEGFTVPEYEMVYLNAGTCQIVLTGIQDVGMNKILLEKITLTEYVLKGEEGEEEEGSEYIKGDLMVLNFSLSSNSNLINTFPSEVDNWTMNWDLTGTELKNLAQSSRYAKWYAFQYSAGSYNGLKLNLNPAYGDIAFNFNIPEAGWYKLGGNVQASEGHSGKVDFAIKSGEERTKVGTVDMSGVGGTSGAWTKSGFTMPDFEMVYLEAGEKQLILTGTANGVGGMNNILLEKLTLTEYIIPQTELKLSLESSAAIAGEKIAIKAFIQDAGGDIYCAEDLTGENSLTVESTNTSVATIENGYIVSNSEGTAQIKATAKFDGEDYEKTVNFEVISIPEPDFKLVADKPFAFGVGKKMNVQVQGAYSNMVVDLEQAENVYAESSDESVVTATVMQASGKIKVTALGVSEGTANVTVYATYKGIPASVVIPMTVKKGAVTPAVFDLNFTHESFANLNLDLHGLEPDRDKTDPAILARRKTTVYFEISMKTELYYGEAIYFNFTLPQSGEFALNLLGDCYADIGFTGAFYIDDEFIGEFCFSDPYGGNSTEVATTILKRFRNITLEEGVHNLKIERVNKSGGTDMWLKDLIFTPVAAYPEVVGINSTCDKGAFAPGETAENEFSVRMSDGTDYMIPELVENQGKFNVENLIPERMEYNGEIVKAKNAGRAIFEVNASIPDAEDDITAYWQAEVADGQLFDFVRDMDGLDPNMANLLDNRWQVNQKATTVDTNNSSYSLGTSGFSAAFEENQILAIDVDIAKDGIYTVDALAAQLGDAGCAADVYVGETYLGRIDFAADKEIALNTVELKSGINTIYIKKIGGGANMMLKQFALVEIDAMPAFSNVTITSDSDEIEINKTLKATAKIWMDDGRQYHVGPKMDGSVDADNKIAYTVSPTGVYTVDENGLMSGQAIGTAELSAEATVKGEKLPVAKKNFSVIHVLRISADKTFRLIRGETISAKLSATLDEQPVDIAQASEFTVIPVDYRAEGEVKIEDGKAVLYITGLRGGNTTVTVEAVYDGVTGSVAIPVVVNIPSNDDDKVMLEFRKDKENVPATPQEADIFTHGWEINEEVSSPASLGYNNGNYRIDTYGLKTLIKNNEQIAFDIWVKKDGSYAVDLTGTKIGIAGICAGIYIDGQYLGEFDFSHPTETVDSAIIANTKAKLNSVTLQAGRHTVVLRKLAKSKPNKWDQMIWLGALDFVMVEDLSFDYVEAAAEKTLLCAGESTGFTAQAIMSDGSVRLMEEGDEKNYITVTSSDSNVVEVRDGRLYALKPGEATINVKGIVDGVEKVAFIDVTVDDKTLTAVEAEVKGNVYVGNTAQLDIKALAGDREIDLESVDITVTTEDSSIVSVSGTELTGVGIGTATVTVTANFGDAHASKDIEVTVTGDGVVSITAAVGATRMRPGSEGTQITVEGISFLGAPVDLSDAEIMYSTDATDVISISESGYITPLAIGEATVVINVKKGGFEQSKEILITVTDGKIGRSYYTEEKVANARENISKYSWAKADKDNRIALEEQYLDADVLWNMVTTQQLPRSITVGYRYDPNSIYCRYCGGEVSTDVAAVNVWVLDAFNSPWKVQCPHCRRKFPTNDFGSFYKLGIDEYGNWNYEQAHREHYNLFQAEYAAKGVETFEEYDEMRTSGARLPGVGYLKNESATDVASVATVNNGKGLGATESVDSWGVDDGYGYKTGNTYLTQFGMFDESHTYVAYYNRRMFAYTYQAAMINLGYAYMYTGEAKYGRAGAILLDRLADVYPDMDVTEFFPYFPQSDSTSPFGRVEGCIWECNTVKWWIHGYDMFYPAFDDPYVINYLSGKAKENNLENTKSSGNAIRRNIEDGVLREVYKAIKDGDIYGNFGMPQIPLALTAVILDTMPESKEMLDYLMAKDEKWWRQPDHTGGDVLDRLINQVDRDGGTSEGLSQEYSTIWANSIGTVAEILNGYEGYPAADLYKNPKYQKLVESPIKMIQARRSSAAIGDSGVTAGTIKHAINADNLIRAFRASGSTILAQMLYFQNGNKVEGLNEGIFAKNPEDIQKNIRAVIDKYGEYPFDESLMRPASGYAILRDGSWYGKGTLSEKDNQRDFWMMFGYLGTHGHTDALNIGLHAYGLDFAPDLGYPTFADGADEQSNWSHSTINHNTVTVNDLEQHALKVAGTPLHFDDAGRVKVMDAQAPAAYDATDIYRRTVVMVEVDDDISYGVDFFRVKGGTEHLYSFHSQSDEIAGYEGFEPVDQGGGSYAGEGIAYKTKGIVNGYSYLTDVLKAEDPGVNEFYVDFKVEDYRNTIKDNKELYLRLTMLNDFNLSEITFARGENPKRGGNQPWYTYLLARRSSENGEALDTTFTTVLEPYKGARYIKSMSQVEVKRAENPETPVNANGDVARAIKVELENGRTDYIIYATNNQVEYVVDNKISFRGFAGVASYNGDELLYSYLSDGTKLEDMELEMGISDCSSYTGEIVDFTRDTAMENFITVKFEEDVSLDRLEDEVVGRWINVENDGGTNGVYRIEGVSAGEAAGTFDIALGNTTLIRSGENVSLDGGDYTYNIAPRQWFNIPMSATMSSAPVFAGGSNDANVVAGKKFTKTVTATSPAERTITYTATSLPRGASFNLETGEITWTPDNTQVGEHHVAIVADDGVMQTTLHFDVTVYKSAGSTSTPSTDTDSNTPSTGTGSTDTGSGSGSGAGGGASGGGGAGGGGSSSGGDTSTDTGSTDDTSGDTSAGDDTTNIPSERFIDLGNHIWAKDAIYSLVDAGVVNGTSANTYSPANNIKRADFAIMLVRAFGITEGEGENFVDVDANKYYAEELRLAKAAGIVNGVGENKFNPEGEITRQDMMLMLARALDAVEYELSDADQSVLAQFTDAASISDYAKDAVSRVVRDGIIAGANGRINPLAKATRAEVAVMLDRVINEK